MQRFSFQNDSLTLSYLDNGAPGRAVIALHAHWLEGSTYTSLAASLAPHWRVIALDQRGHGYSDHASSYGRDDYIADIDALFAHLSLESAVLLGNSLGGVNAYQFAARHPRRVRALVIEDIGVEIDADTSFVLQWCGTFKSRQELEKRIGPRLLPYLLPSFRENADGWTLAFDPNDMVASQQASNGNYWNDWLATHCPSLLIRGQDSQLTDHAHLEQMASRRQHTEMVTLKGGHVVHQDNPQDFADAVRAFLAANDRADRLIRGET